MKKIVYNTEITCNFSTQGETIETKVRRITQNKEPITDGAPIIHTDRKDGVKPEYNVRTDRFEIAVEAMDKVSKSHIAKREEYMKNKDDKKTKEGSKETGKQAQDGMKKESGDPSQ